MHKATLIKATTDQPPLGRRVWALDVELDQVPAVGQYVGSHGEIASIEPKPGGRFVCVLQGSHFKKRGAGRAQGEWRLIEGVDEAKLDEARAKEKASIRARAKASQAKAIKASATKKGAPPREHKTKKDR